MGGLPDGTLMKRNRRPKAMGLTSVPAKLQGVYRGCQGLTLVEVIIASLVVAVVAGGTMMAFIASANMTGPYNPTGPQDLSSLAEANDLAQQLVESQRNENGVVAGNPNPLSNQVALGWQAATMPAGGSASQLTGARRCFRVVNADCDGVGGPGDCFGVQAQVCWNNLAGCACP